MREYVRLKRYPFAPLARAVGAVYFIPGETPNKSRFRNFAGTPPAQLTKGNPSALISELAGVSVRTIQRWAISGIPVSHADKIACALGMHPSEIWPEWFGPYGLTV